MSDRTIYKLLCELVNHEKKKLWPETKVVDIDSVLLRLRHLSNKDFGYDTEKWINWFISDDANSREDIESLSMIWRIHNIEKISLKKIKDQSN
jgi:hypothetical protein